MKGTISGCYQTPEKKENEYWLEFGRFAEELHITLFRTKSAIIQKHSPLVNHNVYW